MFSIIFLLSFLFAGEYQTRVLENDVLKITLERKERTEAEPASQPYEVRIQIDCKKRKNVLGVQMNFPVCDFDPQDKETVMSNTQVKIAHFSWDAVKSSNNPEGKVFCDSKKKLYHEVDISGICQPPQKATPTQKK
jgi:hypothetical protein